MEAYTWQWEKERLGMSVQYKSRYKSLTFAISYELQSLQESLKKLEMERDSYKSDTMVALYSGMISERKNTIALLERWVKASKVKE